MCEGKPARVAGDVKGDDDIPRGTNGRPNVLMWQCVDVLMKNKNRNKNENQIFQKKQIPPLLDGVGCRDAMHRVSQS
jgi:hypothetical protein